jgi:hypothetical protein
VPPAAPPPRATAPVEKGKSVQMETKLPRDPPDAALLDYLGRYGDAAIGLDPIGLDPGDPAELAPDDDTDAAAPRSDGKHDEH